MITIVLDVFVNALALMLFCQSLWIVGFLAIRRQPLVPLVEPVEQPNDKLPQAHRSQKTLSSEHVLSETQLAIAKAVHPHLHSPEHQSRSGSQHAKPLGNNVPVNECERVCLFKLDNSKIYQSTIPYSSVCLATMQALLGVSVTLAFLIWQVSGLQNCQVLSHMLLSGFHVGFALLMLASALQTHTTNAMCIKIFFIMSVGLGAHFTMFGLVLANNTAVSATDSNDNVCLVDIAQPQNWLGRLPLYSSIAHFFMCFFSSISFINAAFRLCANSRFIVPREIIAVFMVYRGLGTLFANVVVGVVASAVISFLSAFSSFHFIPCWMLLWAVMSRIMAAALWHRTHTDVDAPYNSFWMSPTYMALCNKHSMPPQGSTLSASDAYGYAWPEGSALKPSLLQIVLEITRLSALAPAAPEATASSASLESLLALASEEAEPRPLVRDLSRHDTIVEDSPCISCRYIGNTPRLAPETLAASHNADGA